MLAGLATADEKPGVAANKVPRTADGHPDLSGIWAYAIDLPPVVFEGTGQWVRPRSRLSTKVGEKPAKGSNTGCAGRRLRHLSYKTEFQEKSEAPVRQ